MSWHKTICLLLIIYSILFQIWLFQKVRFIPSMSPNWKRKLADLCLVSKHPDLYLFLRESILKESNWFCSTYLYRNVVFISPMKFLDLSVNKSFFNLKFSVKDHHDVEGKQSLIWLDDILRNNIILKDLSNIQTNKYFT